MFRIDHRALSDLTTFAHLEIASKDVEPWALIIRELYTNGDLNTEQALWVLSLYNTYDSLGSAWQIFQRWTDPLQWAVAVDGQDAAQYPIMQERRNLFGGRVLRRLNDYSAHLTNGQQMPWLTSCLVFDDAHADYARLMKHLRQIWGVGRLAAFEWAEFLAKVTDFPVHSPDAELWESSGPRKSLEKIYGNNNPTQDWLTEAAVHCRQHLRDQGVPLEWEDFETIICDFNVMRGGRYYVGRHLAALKQEICELPDAADREILMAAWRRIIPAEWVDIPPGINKVHMPLYKETGLIRDCA